ncbi:MAG TPA: hypothetical protein VGV12_10575 [Gemmatimonadales bacterium]|nr:hypothetical protein [Gemmatimonadales bacterium]
MKAVRRLDGWTVRGGALALVLLTVYPTTRLYCQDSQFGILGLGTPGRYESVRARSTGGAFTPFDPLSTLTEAPLADLGTLTATAMEGTSYRQADLAGSTTSVRSTRFPLLNVAGRVAPRLAVAAGFTTYLDKSWDVTERDSTLLRGTLERYTDELTSDGSVADLRLAAASRLTRRIAIGAGIHLLAGSTRETAERRFDDTTFHTVRQLAEVRYSGFGVSGSILIGVAPGLSLAGWARSDGRLRAKAGDTTTALTDLPRGAGGGLLFAPSPKVKIGGSVAWRSWSRTGPGAFNTWSWSGGAEIGSGRMPLRLGVRGGQLPFGPGTTAPTEVAATAGTGRTFAQGRASLDLGVERLERRGTGLTERIWTVLVGITVRP